MQEVEWELGLRTDRPSGGHRTLEQIEPKVPVKMAPSLGAHPLVAQLLIQRAMAISTDPATESLLLLYPGGGEDGGAEWATIAADLAAQIQGTTRFQAVIPATLGKEAIQAALAKLPEGSRALAVSLFVSTNGFVTRIIPETLKDLPVTFHAEGLFPDPIIRAYVRARLKEVLGDWEPRPGHAYAMNRIRVRPGTGALLEERFRTRRGVETLPGFISFEMVKGPVTPEWEEYIILTKWESPQDFHNWTRSEVFRQGHAGTRAPGATAFILSSEGGLYQPQFGTYGRVVTV